LDPYKPYVLKRWNEGCHTGAVLLREIAARGYAGGPSLMLSYITQLRKAQGLPPKKRLGVTAGAAMDPTRRTLTPRRSAWLILQPPSTLETTAQQQLVQTRQIHPHIERGVMLAQAFATLVREHQAQILDAWLAQAEQSDIPALKGFASGLRRDYAAVRAGVSLPWSQGQVEGQVNRLKMLKRQMYGRASFPLLPQRVLAA